MSRKTPKIGKSGGKKVSLLRWMFFRFRRNKFSFLAEKEMYRKWKEDKMIKKLEKEQLREKEKEEEQMNSEERECKTGRLYTVSVALPGSILDNAQSPELRTYLAGQIARAAVVFGVDEIIVFDETSSTTRDPEGDITSTRGREDGNIQLARILQYLECPQYLRKALFPQHSHLKYAGLLNPLDCPHHMRTHEQCPYREGVVIDRPVKPGKGSFVNVGLPQEAQIDKLLQARIRVTVKMKTQDPAKKKLKGKVVSPYLPREEAGLYWGYNVRLAKSLSGVFTECPYKDGYDVTVGTSENGTNVDEFEFSQKFRHLLLVFGGVKGLEVALEADESLSIDDPCLLFHHYIDTCPGQASRTIRTEEALLITLSALRPSIYEVQGLVPKPFHDT